LDYGGVIDMTAFDKAWNIVKEDKMFAPGFFDRERNMKRQATKGTECKECGMPKRTSTNMMMLSDDEMCNCEV